jgi:predicted nucleic acid-binding protein
MQSVLPFSALKNHSIVNLKEGAIVDSNILIAAMYDPHSFYEEACDLLRELRDNQIPLFATVTVRTEYLDFARRILLTEKLMDVYSDSRKYKLSERVKTELKKHKTWIDIEAAKSSLPVLTDTRLKDCKQVFDPNNHSGKLGWLKFCEAFLADKLLKHWQIIEESFGINYLQLRGLESEQFLNKAIDWKDMYLVIEKTGISSHDAMIINAFMTSKFSAIFTADFDVAYSVAAEKNVNKVCFIPDSLYQRVKKMKFE